MLCSVSVEGLFACSISQSGVECACSIRHRSHGSHLLILSADLFPPLHLHSTSICQASHPPFRLSPDELSLPANQLGLSQPDLTLSMSSQSNLAAANQSDLAASSQPGASQSSQSTGSSTETEPDLLLSGEGGKPSSSSEQSHKEGAEKEEAEKEEENERMEDEEAEKEGIEREEEEVKVEEEEEGGVKGFSQGMFTQPGFP